MEDTSDVEASMSIELSPFISVAGYPEDDPACFALKRWLRRRRIAGGAATADDSAPESLGLAAFDGPSEAGLYVEPTKPDAARAANIPDKRELLRRPETRGRR